MIEEHRKLNFWKKVDKSGDCWNWTACKNRDGYGVFNAGVFGESYSASRFCWILHNGLIPDGLYVLHKCDNRACVNPAHLFLGTNQDNMDDMKNKGRASWGEKNVNAKLNREQVLEIKTLLKLGSSCKSLADNFGVYHSTIRKIRNGKLWVNVS